MDRDGSGKTRVNMNVKSEHQVDWGRAAADAQVVMQ